MSENRTKTGPEITRESFNSQRSFKKHPKQQMLEIAQFSFINKSFLLYVFYNLPFLLKYLFI